jgi:hypothetical protein
MQDTTDDYGLHDLRSSLFSCHLFLSVLQKMLLQTSGTSSPKSTPSILRNMLLTASKSLPPVIWLVYPQSDDRLTQSGAPHQHTFEARRPPTLRCIELGVGSVPSIKAAGTKFCSAIC